MLQQTRFSFKIWKTNFILEKVRSDCTAGRQERKERVPTSFCLGTLYRNRSCQNTIAIEGKWQGELHQVTKSGKEIIVESRWTLVREQEEKPKSILIVNTDITEKQLEAQRAQRLESLGTLLAASPMT